MPDRTQPEHDAPRPARAGHHQVLDDRAIGDDLGRETGAGGQRDLMHLPAIDGAEARDRHLASSACLRPAGELRCAGQVQARAVASRVASRARLRSEPAGPMIDNPSGAPMREATGIEICGTPERPERHKRLMALLR